jgi:arylsulfatase A-like enzyme
LNRGFAKYVCVNEPNEDSPKPSEDDPDPVFVMAVKYLSTRTAGSRPLFMFVQTFAVHNYYQEPLGPDDARGDKAVFQRNLDWVKGANPCSPEAWKQLEAAYARRVTRMNRDFESLATALKSAGLWESSVIVFTSDHGEAFEPEIGRTHHGGQLYANVIRVPLMVRMPGLAPREEAAPVSLIDVMPSLLELTGTEIPDGLDGRSFLRVLSDPSASLPPRTLFAMEHAFWRDAGGREMVEKLSALPLSAAAIRGNLWCIRGGHVAAEANLGPGAVEELYDMIKDPDQRQPLSQEPDPLSLEQSVGGALGGRTRTNLRGKNKELDDQLKRLGYTR